MRNGPTTHHRSNTTANNWLDGEIVDDCPVKDRSDRHSQKARYRARDRRRSGFDDDSDE